MENNNLNEGQYQQQPPKRKKPVLLIVVIVLLVGALGILGIQYLNLKEDAEATEMVLEEQKNDLTNELNEMYVEYDSLKTENDSMNLKLEAEQAKIKRLLAINASNAQKIQIYKKELGTLRDIMKSYIVQIDSLNQRNQALMEENRQVRTQLAEVETTRRSLEDEKEQLTDKVNKASVLQAKDIIASPLNKRSKERDRVRAVEKVRVCFTLRENAIIEPGTKTIYMRIIRPDEIVLADNASNLFEYNGEMVVFTAKRDVEYENQDVEMCIYWDRNEELIDGTYSVDLFHDGNVIGTTTFSLR
jgi:Tfp pilus assembly protein PilN